VKPATYLVQWENKLYCYDRADLLKIALFSNAREGLIADGLWKLVPEGFSYRYDPMDQDELLPAPVPVQQLEGRVA